MDLYHLIEKWKLNHNHLSELINMPKGTFNNKLNPNHFSYFNNAEIMDIKSQLRILANDIRGFVNTYQEPEEILTGNPDEELVYNRGKKK